MPQTVTDDITLQDIIDANMARMKCWMILFDPVVVFILLALILFVTTFAVMGKSRAPWAQAFKKWNSVGVLCAIIVGIIVSASERWLERRYGYQRWIAHFILAVTYVAIVGVLIWVAVMIQAHVYESAFTRNQRLKSILTAIICIMACVLVFWGFAMAIVRYKYLNLLDSAQGGVQFSPPQQREQTSGCPRVVVIDMETIVDEPTYRRTEPYVPFTTDHANLVGRFLMDMKKQGIKVYVIDGLDYPYPPLDAELHFQGLVTAYVRRKMARSQPASWGRRTPHVMTLLYPQGESLPDAEDYSNVAILRKILRQEGIRNLQNVIFFTYRAQTRMLARHMGYENTFELPPSRPQNNNVQANLQFMRDTIPATCPRTMV